ncbi:MAG: right-handed parallel beta-helix repeat-containing protein, partial [Candidatus Tectomicrobia bacterium]|nr:right-handed parallel beta-helix repeat-containing protein [Candidatus Tectomicrobia bacterium]
MSNFRNDQNGDGVPEAQALGANQIAFVLSPKGGRQTGIIMEQGSTFNVVHGNEVRNWKRNGIEVLGHSNDNDILRNSIHDVMGIGVQVFASVRTDILENHLFDLGNEESPAPAVGVFLWSTADANPARGQNVLQRNLLEDIWGYGIGLYRSSEETIGGTQPGQGNTLRRMVMGALLYESGRNLVAGNNFSQIGGSEESPGVAIYL